MERLSNQPQRILEDAFARFDLNEIAISFSGAEDVVLIDMASRICSEEFRVFSLDTGRLHPETYEFIETVRNHYSVPIEVLSPDAAEVEQLVRDKGLFSFYEDGHTQCCSIRKIHPLQAILSELGAWITGQRRDQGVTRTDVPTEQVDAAFSDDHHRLIKFNPLAEWNSDEVWDYIRSNNVPYNPLHDRGFASLGCAPCTRAIKPGEPERAGRWWWEQEDEKECGLHIQNLEVNDR